MSPAEGPAGAGLEVRLTEPLRERCARTIGAWYRTPEQPWSEFVAVVGEPTARARRFHLVGSGLAFVHHRIRADKIFTVRTDDHSEAPLRITPTNSYREMS
ncbi:hypothetical protein ACFVZW_25675 [Streptomyces sp. NPDC059567]|uniref:hypothetical protein n=1 Tax=Streptomyces sp. NPDC059567 TaxID=3346867 RepID=UPI0036CA7220